ncbi:MAG: glycosyltransferase family 2 protein [Pseudomonadota bacterium]
MPHITAVVPVLNEEPNIKELVTRLCAALDQIGEDYSLMIVDDGSTDQTWPLLQEIAKTEPRVGGLKLSRNFGQHAAITAGLANTDADWVVVLDGDLQDRPEVIPELYAKSQEGYSCVYVERQDRPESKLYLAGQKAFYSFLRALTTTEYDGRHGNFSIISREVVENYNQLAEGGRFYGGLVHWLGFPKASIQAKHGERFAGKPSYNLTKRFSFAKAIILSFSTRPLDITLAVGMGVTIVALALGVFTLVGALFFGYSVEGWASIMISIYFLGGVQMMMIGMVGLYVGRISEEVKRRPGYVASDRITAVSRDRTG